MQSIELTSKGLIHFTTECELNNSQLAQESPKGYDLSIEEPAPFLSQDRWNHY